MVVDPAVTARIADAGARARVAARELALLTRADKDAALRALADAVDAASAHIVEANDRDLERGRSGGMAASLQDRLRLTPERIGAIAQALRDVAGLADPVGEVVRGSTLANGLQIRQVRVPMGVVGMIYEARPNVTVDAAGLGLKSGNAMILRGGSAAADSNRALVQVLRDALRQRGIHPEQLPLDRGVVGDDRPAQHPRGARHRDDLRRHASPGERFGDADRPPPLTERVDERAGDAHRRRPRACATM